MKDLDAETTGGRQSQDPGDGTRTDYYTSTGRKILDFLTGFLGINFVLCAVALASTSANWNTGIVLSAAAYIALIVFAFIRGRRFIAIGMLCFLLIPILVFGACVLTFHM